MEGDCDKHSIRKSTSARTEQEELEFDYVSIWFLFCGVCLSSCWENSKCA